MSDRAVAVVIDPIASVKGKIVMDVFRSIHPNLMGMAAEPRISTSNLYYTKDKPSKMAKLRGLNRLYYNMVIETYSRDNYEIDMLTRMKESTKGWSENFKIHENFAE